MNKNPQCFIQVKDGNPVDHPIVLDNVRQNWPDLDLMNLPDTWAYFDRKPPERPGPYQKNPVCRYQLYGGFTNRYTDVWTFEEMTDSEKIDKQNKVKDEWIAGGSNTTYPSWVFNDKTCAYEPPVAPPPDDGNYTWDERLVSWEPVWASPEKAPSMGVN